MRPSIVLAGLLAGTITAAQGQASDSIQYRHQLGLAAAPRLAKFFTANHSLPVGLVYKRQVRPNQAWRVIVTLSRYSSRQDFQYVAPDAYSLYSQGAYTLAVGREFQQPLGKHIVGYAGADFVLGYASTYTEARNYFKDDVSNLDYVDEVERRNSSWSAGIRPLVGMKYQLQRRLSLSIESTLIYNHTWTKEKGTTLLFAASPREFIASGINVDATARVSVIRFQPLQSLLLTYHF